MNQDRPETRGELLDAWTRHLSLRRGLSEHTVRAYAGDLEDLLAFLGVDPDESAPVGPVLRGLTLADLRAWLAALAASGHSRATLARRSAAMRTFSTWAFRSGLLGRDVALRLHSPRVDNRLPAVLTVEQARDLLAAAGRIAVPGCNVTAVTLAAQPGVAAELIDAGQVTAVLAVGYSGAGKALKPHLTAAEALGSAQPYAVGGVHRHIPEIVQNLEVAGARPGAVRLSFTPVLVPMSRGILATVTAPVTEAVLSTEHPGEVLRSAWERAYGGPGEGEALIHLLPEGVWPTTGAVAGSGLATVQVAYDRAAGVAVMMCAIDNLGKGTASAAVQCLNLALGLGETTGVVTEGVAP